MKKNDIAIKKGFIENKEEIIFWTIIIIISISILVLFVPFSPNENWVS
jgi:ABC-type methionine transport system permease subunit